MTAHVPKCMRVGAGRRRNPAMFAAKCCRSLKLGAGDALGAGTAGQAAGGRAPGTRAATTMRYATIVSGNRLSIVRRIRHEPTICYDQASYGLGVLATSALPHIAQLQEKPGFFANETHSQVDIIRLTNARSAAT
jgi:hypothetical protein